MNRARNRECGRAKAFWRRRGIVVVFTAVMLVVLLGVTALCIDTMVLSIAKGQLRTASDGAALAGAAQLASDRRISSNTSNLTPEISAAKESATSLARLNKVLGTAPVVSSGENGGVGDVVVGYLDPTEYTTSIDSGTAVLLKFNSVQVTLSRSASRGGMIPTTFARVLGISGMQTRASGSATAMLFRIGGFKGGLGMPPHLLPIVLDKSAYNKMIDPAYSTTDQYTWSESTNQVTGGADGVEESQLYPVKNGSPGNWGTINVGVSANSTKVLGEQIEFGITPSQMATFPNSTIQLNAATSPPSINFTGDPGISSGIKDNLERIIGRPVTLPIYDSVTGNGNNSVYRVVDFAPVRIMAVDFKGNPKFVIVQPALARDPTAIPSGAPLTGWSRGGLVRLHLSR